MHLIILIHQLWAATDFFDSVNKTFDSLWKSKENDDAGWLSLASLDKSTKNRDEFYDKN